MSTCYWPYLKAMRKATSLPLIITLTSISACIGGFDTGMSEDAGSIMVLEGELKEYDEEEGELKEYAAAAADNEEGDNDDDSSNHCPMLSPL